MQKLRVYKGHPSTQYIDIAFSPSNTPDEVIPMLRLQEANSINNKYGLMICSNETSISWLPSDIEFSRIIILKDDKVFAEPLNKSIDIKWPDGSSDTMIIDMKIDAKCNAEIICSYFEVWPHQVWSIYTKTATGNMMLIPGKSIAEQFPNITEIIMKQTIFPPSVDESIASPLHVYISQYRQMILDNEFLLESDDIKALRSYKWFNNKERTYSINRSNEDKEEEFRHLISLKGFGAMNYMVRMHITDEEGNQTDQLPRILSISTVALSIYKYGDQNAEFVRSYGTIFGFALRGPYLKIAFDEEGKCSWFIMSSKCQEILTVLESTIKFGAVNQKQSRQLSGFATSSFIEECEKPLIQEKTEVTENETLRNLLSELFESSKKCIKDEQSHKIDISTTQNSLAFRSLLQTSQEMLDDIEDVDEKLSKTVNSFTQHINTLSAPCKRESNVFAMTTINNSLGTLFNKKQKKAKEAAKASPMSTLTKEDRDALNSSMFKSLNKVSNILSRRGQNEEEKEQVSDTPILSFSAEDLNTTPEDVAKSLVIDSSSDSEREVFEFENRPFNGASLADEMDSFDRFRSREQSMQPASPPIHGMDNSPCMEIGNMSSQIPQMQQQQQLPPFPQPPFGDCSRDQNGIPLPFDSLKNQSQCGACFASQANYSNSNGIPCSPPYQQSMPMMSGYPQSPVNSYQMSPGQTMLGNQAMMSSIPMQSQYGMQQYSPMGQYCMQSTMFPGTVLQSGGMMSMSPVAQEKQTPASPVNVQVSIDNSKKKGKGRKKKSHKHESSSDDETDDSETESSSSYASHKKSPKKYASPKRLFKSERSRFVDVEGLNSNGLLSEIEETVDRIIMALESGESTKVEQNTLSDLINEIQNRKDEFNNENAVSDLLFSAQKLAETKNLSTTKASRLSEDVEQQIRILRKSLKPNKEPKILNFTATLPKIEPIVAKKAAETEKLPFVFTNGDSRMVSVQGQKPNNELERSLDMLKATMLTASNTFSNI